VVSAEPGASLLLGFKPGLTRESFLKALQNHALENLFRRHFVRAEDTFFVPAGTPHTIGPDMVLCEVQEYSDITYRVYDYGRLDSSGKPRELHIERALEVIDFGPSEVMDFGGNCPPGKIKPLPLSAESATRSLLTTCPYFTAERWEFFATVQLEPSLDHFELLVPYAGRGYIHWKGSPLPYQAGQCWLIPASLGHFSLQPEQKSALIKAFLPASPPFLDKSSFWTRAPWR